MSHAQTFQAAKPVTGRTLLLVSGTEPRVAQGLHDMGHTLAVMDADPQAPAFAFADSCLIAEVWRPDDCTAAADRYSRKIRRLEGVISAVDAPMTAASIAARLRLPGLPAHVAELMGDRLITRRAFLSAGVAMPWHAQIFTPQELQRAIIARGRDLLLKPAEKLGPSTEFALAKVDDPAAAFGEVRAASPSGRVVVEQARDLRALPAFMLSGRCFMRADENLRMLVERGAQAMQLNDGPVVAEITDADGGPQLVELSSRLSRDCEFLDAAVALACGESVSPIDLAV